MNLAVPGRGFTHLETAEVCGFCLSDDHENCTTSIRWVDPDKSVRGAVCQCHALNHGKLRPWQQVKPAESEVCTHRIGGLGESILACGKKKPCPDHDPVPVTGKDQLFLPGEGD